jgi:hypothetical protein
MKPPLKTDPQPKDSSKGSTLLHSLLPTNDLTPLSLKEFQELKSSLSDSPPLDRDFLIKALHTPIPPA